MYRHILLLVPVDAILPSPSMLGIAISGQLKEDSYQPMYLDLPRSSYKLCVLLLWTIAFRTLDEFYIILDFYQLCSDKQLHWNTLYFYFDIVCSVFVHVSMFICYWHSTCTCILFVCVFAHAIYICIIMLWYVSDQTMDSRLNYYYVTVCKVILYF